MKRTLAMAAALVMAIAAAGCTVPFPGVSGSQLPLRAPRQPDHVPNDAPRRSAPAPQHASATTGAHAPLPLEQCVDIALKNNPGIAERHWDTRTALAEKDIAQGRLWPTLRAVGGYTYFRDERLIKPRRPGTREVLSFTDQLLTGEIVLSMPLYTGGRLRNQVKAADLLAQAAKERLLYSRTELVFNVSSVFYSMLGQQAVIHSLMFSQKALQEHHKRAQQLLAAQKAARVDLLRTEVRLADIEQQLLRQENLLNIQRFLLASLLGLDRQDEPLQIDGELTLTDVPASVDEGLARALANRQDYQSLRARVSAQQKRLDVARAGRLPELSVRASYGNRWATDSDDHNEVGQVGIFGVIPLFEGGRIAARMRRERSRLRAQQEALRKLQLKIQLEVQTASSNIESTHARVGVTRKAVEQGKESLRIEREKYDLGKGAIVDILDAQSALLDSQTNYYRALAAYNTALAQFRLAVGETQ